MGTEAGLWFRLGSSTIDMANLHEFADVENCFSSPWMRKVIDFRYR